MGTVKYEELGITTLLSTELNSLASNTRVLSPSHDNGIDLAFWADFELLADYGTAPAAGTLVELYLVQSVDATNFIDGSASVVPQASTHIGSFELRNITTDQRLVIEGIRIPPREFKIILWNKGGQAMSASGHTLKMRKYTTQADAT